MNIEVIIDKMAWMNKLIIAAILYGIGWLAWKFPLEVSLIACISAIIFIGLILLNKEQGVEW